MRALYTWRSDGEDKVEITLPKQQGRLVVTTLPALWRKETSVAEPSQALVGPTLLDSPMSPPRRDRKVEPTALLSKEQQVLVYLHTATLEKLENNYDVGTEKLQYSERQDWIAALQAARVDLLDAQLPKLQLEGIRDLIYRAQLLFS